jgi:hypothetical protein
MNLAIKPFALCRDCHAAAGTEYRLTGVPSDA